MSIRIIAGDRRGLTLKTVEFAGFRPTLGRVRESLFGTLEPVVEGARVLDLFAGSGALGIEALSRGAIAAIFIDNHRKAVKVIEQNLEKSHFEDRSRVHLGDFAIAGKKVAREEQFDLVFADPPYLQGFPQRVIHHLLDVNLLTENGLLCLEMDRREMRELDFKGFEVVRDKKYGSTHIWIMRRLI